MWFREKKIPGLSLKLRDMDLQKSTKESYVPLRKKKGRDIVYFLKQFDHETKDHYEIETS